MREASDVGEEEDDADGAGAAAAAEGRRRRRAQRAGGAPVSPGVVRRIGDVDGAVEGTIDEPRGRDGVESTGAAPLVSDETEGRAAAAPARIDEIVEQGRKEGRYRVAVDGQRSLVVSAEIVERLAMRVGLVLTAAQVVELQGAAGALATYDRALNVLASRARSSTDLRRRLIEKGEPAAFVDRAIERLVVLGMLDDAQFARQFARGRIAGTGASKRRVQQELYRKGVARGLADEAIAEVMEDENVDEDAIVERAARKKMRSLAKLDAPTRQRRLYAHLARRGFDADAIRRGMKCALLDAELEPPDSPA